MYARDAALTAIEVLYEVGPIIVTQDHTCSRQSTLHSIERALLQQADRQEQRFTATTASATRHLISRHVPLIPKRTNAGHQPLTQPLPKTQAAGRKLQLHDRSGQESGRRNGKKGYLVRHPSEEKQNRSAVC